MNPSATELCNGEDDNCDGSTDGSDSSDATTWYLDGDEDGYGTISDSIMSCSQPTGYATSSDDCNDGDASISPQTLWYADADGDGFGTNLYTTQSCTQPAGYVDSENDCRTK